jgi:hypothetical protein
MLDAGTIKPTSTHSNYEEAEQAAKKRSDSIKIKEEEEQPDVIRNLLGR